MDHYAVGNEVLRVGFRQIIYRLLTRRLKRKESSGSTGPAFGADERVWGERRQDHDVVIGSKVVCRNVSSICGEDAMVARQLN